LKGIIPNITIKKGRILRDVFCENNSTVYKLQFGFFDQDIIIYNETMDISKFRVLENIKILNNHENIIYIPKIICELKYNDVNTHGVITYSDIASDIKSIFPLCKYLLLLRYRNSSSDNKLLRNGKTFDNILCFDDEKAPEKSYTKGDFQDDLKKDHELHERYESFLEYVKINLIGRPKKHLMK
jgi:hypothetical protein